MYKISLPGQKDNCYAAAHIYMPRRNYYAVSHCM